MKMNRNSHALFTSNTMNRDTALECLHQNSFDAKTTTELSRILALYDSGIHELSNGMKINATKDRLLGGGFFGDIGGKLMSFFSDKAAPALKAAAQAGWNSLTGQTPSDNEETNIKQLALLEEKFNKLEASMRQQMEQKLSTLAQEMSALNANNVKPYHLDILNDAAKQLKELDLPAKTEDVKLDISNLAESSVFNMRSNVLKANNNQGLVQNNVGKFVNSGTISFGK